MKDDGFDLEQYLNEADEDIERTRLEPTGKLTFGDLYKNSQVVLPTTVNNARGFPYQFQDFTKIPFIGTKSIRYLGVVTSQTRENERYPLEITFYDVDVEDNEKPNTDRNPVRVRCNCPAYYFYFSHYNWREKAHVGTKPKQYKRKTSHIPERNPRHLPGVCKHLIAFVEILIRSGEVK